MPTPGPNATDQDTASWRDRRTTVRQPSGDVESGWADAATQSFDARLTVSDTSGSTDVAQFRDAHAVVASDASASTARRTTLRLPSGDQPLSWSETAEQSVPQPSGTDTGSWEESTTTLVVTGLQSTEVLGGLQATRTELDVAPGVPPVAQTDADSSGNEDGVSQTVYRPTQFGDGRLEEATREAAALTGTDTSGSQDQVSARHLQVADRSSWFANHQIDRAGDQDSRVFDSSRSSEATAQAATVSRTDTSASTSQTAETATANPTETGSWADVASVDQVTQSHTVSDSSRFTWTHIEVIRVPFSPDREASDSSGWRETVRLDRTDLFRGEAIGIVVLTQRLEATAVVA